MKNDNTSIIATVGVLLLFIVLILILIFLSNRQNKESTIGCQEVGYKEYRYYNREPYCIDNNGYYHKIIVDCNFLVNKCTVKEIKWLA